MKTDVVLDWAHGAFPTELRGGFMRPVKFVTLPKLKPDSPFAGFSEAISELGPQPLRTYFRRNGIDPLRIAAVGFSASCSGLMSILASQDAGNMDTVIAIDGIHGHVDVWAKFGALAAFGAPAGSPLPAGPRTLVITHSSVKPPYMSTTESAARILDLVFSGQDVSGYRSHLEGLWDVGLPYKCRNPLGKVIEYTTTPNVYAVSHGGLTVLGYSNLDPSGGHCDHIYQAKKIMPLVCQKLLVERWNAEDPYAGTCAIV